jgi:hypothetical protein
MRERRKSRRMRSQNEKPPASGLCQLALNSERKFNAQPPLPGSNLNLTPIGETIAVVLCRSR